MYDRSMMHVLTNNPPPKMHVSLTHGLASSLKFYSGSFISSLRRIGLNSGFGALSGSVPEAAWLGILPGSFSGCSTTPGMLVSISVAILFRKLFT